MREGPRIVESGLRELGPRLLWSVLAVGLVLRVLAWLLLGDKLPSHGFEAGVISDSIAAGRGYSMPFYFTDIPIRSFIPPFYPSLMALLKLGVIAGAFYLVSRVSETAVLLFILGLSIVIVTIVIEGVYQLYIHRRRGVTNG